MLKVGSIRWRGKCSRHPSFDPYSDGRAAIKGGCKRCEELAEINECHQRMLGLMRGFAPPVPRKKPVQASDLQESLF